MGLIKVLGSVVSRGEESFASVGKSRLELLTGSELEGDRLGLSFFASENYSAEGENRKKTLATSSESKFR